jgi:transcriptional regulator with XRE-family HTH domain
MNKNVALRSLPLAFSRRLRGAMDIRCLTIAQLASASSITKSALSRLLSDEIELLPHTYTLIKLAHALDVSLEYLLGLGVNRTDSAISFGAEFFPSPFSSENTIPEELFLSQTNGYFIYVCETVPELLKTQAVLEIELGNVDVAVSYHARMEAVRCAAATRENNGLVLMDGGIIDQLLSGTGRYVGLSAAQIREQIGILGSFFKSQSPMVSASVVDYRKNGLSQVFLSTPCRVVSRLGDGYVAAGNSELYQHLRQTARSAFSEGVAFSDYVTVDAYSLESLQRRLGLSQQPQKVSLRTAVQKFATEVAG